MGALLNYLIKKTAIKAATNAVITICDSREKIAKENAKAINKSNSCVTVPSDCGDYRGRNYKEVRKELKAYGFTNIGVLGKEDLSFGKRSKNEKVKEVIINGNNYFEKGDLFQPGVRVVIVYHSMGSDAMCPNCKSLVDVENQKYCGSCGAYLG